MQPAPELVKQLPTGAGANVLAEPGGQCVVQLIGGAGGEKLQMDLPRGDWVFRWINPATGRESHPAVSEEPVFLAVQGRAVLLLGGSWQDNLFNHPVGLERHLDLLNRSAAITFAT
jgi:hypothetical protein